MQDYIKRFFSAGLIVLLGLGFPSEVWASPESGSGYMLVRNYGEPGMGAITAALGTAGCSNRTLILSPGIWTVGADLTIPNNISLKLERGAILVVARGKTLTLQGPVISGNYTIFAGNGSVSLAGGVKEVYPQWWGAKGYGTANDAAALQAAANAGARTMIIPPGTYRLATQLVDSYVINGHHYSNGYVIHIPSGLSILGAGEGKTILQVAVPYTSAFYNRGERDFAISGLTIEGFGRNENSAGMKFLTADNYSVARVEVKGMRMGFQALGCTNGHYWDCHAYDQRNTSDSDDARGFNVGDQTDHTGTKNITYANCTASFSAGHGFSIVNAKDIQMANCSAIQNGYQGFYIYDSSHIKLNNCFARGNKYVGFFLTLLSLCTFENCQAVNQGQEGFKLQGCTSCTFKNIRVLDNSTASSGRYPGINLADWKGKGSLHNTFAGCISDNSRNIGQNYGLAVTGANSGRNVIMDGDYRHNVRGNLFLPHRHLELDNNSFP